MMTPSTRLIHLAPLLFLCACASTGGSDPLRAAAPLTPTEQYGIEVRDTPHQVMLKANPAGLSPAQEAALVQLAADWRQAGGGGDIVVQSPTGGDPAAGRLTADASMAVLADLGVPPSRIRLVGYNNAPDQPVAIIVGYSTYQAIGPQCGQSWENLSKTGNNAPYKQFGCATTANMAAQIANPADLVAPRPTDPADATRRSTVLAKYRAGEPTASAVEEQAGGTVSSAASGN